MKKIHHLILIIVICILQTTVSNLHAQDVQYGYDAAGNRVVRKVVTGASNMRQGNTDSIVNTFADYTNSFEVLLTSNPTKGNLLVNITSENHIINNYKVLVVDNLGQTIVNRTEISSSFKINLENYPAGIYYLNIVANKEISNWKVIKE